MSGQALAVCVADEQAGKRHQERFNSLLLAGRCMAHELEKAGIRPDLVEAWRHCAEAACEGDVNG